MPFTVGVNVSDVATPLTPEESIGLVEVKTLPISMSQVGFDGANTSNWTVPVGVGASEPPA